MQDDSHQPEDASSGPEDFSEPDDSPAREQGDGRRKRILCPSAPAAPNAILLGVVVADGSIAFLADRIEVTQEFVTLAQARGTPEARFRFSSPCVSGACKQWANGACSLPDRLAELLPPVPVADLSLPPCPIRDECRWFAQQGPNACRLCPQVTTRSEAQLVELTDEPVAEGERHV